MATTQKIRNDIAKTKEKIAEQQKRLRALEAQLAEEENLEIVRMVKAVKMDNKELTAFLKSLCQRYDLPAGKVCCRRETPRMRKRRDMRMKHNFMTKSGIGSFWRIVLSTAAFLLSPPLPAAARKARSLWLNRKRLGMSLICFPLWQAARSRYPSPRMVSSSVPAKMTLSRPAPSPRAAAI